MASEETPLYVPYDNEDVYIELDEADDCIPAVIRKNKFLKYSLVLLLSAITLGIFYLLMVVLPNLAPDGVEIPDIPLIKYADYFLHPLAQSKYSSPSKPSDPDNPNKPLPNFTAWPKLSTKDKLFNLHFEELLKLNDKIQFSKKRIIMVGDVHGSLNELKKLLTKLDYDKRDDKVILLGDFIDKGEDSIPVINFAIQNEIDCVLGNHELEILKRYSQFHAVKPPVFSNSSHPINIEESYDLDEMMKIAKKLTSDHIHYLGNCSPIQSIGPVAHVYMKKSKSKAKTTGKPLNGLAVHGGLLWNKPLEEQSPDDITTIRNVLPPTWDKATDDPKSKVDGVKSKAWGKIWNQKQTEFVRQHEETSTELTLGDKVFYGHDAKRGVVSMEFSQGLDSGCVYGKRLTAVVLWAEVSQDKNIVYKHRLAEVNC